ncbi:MAG TPA: carbohydrate kinase [Gaiellaceae bacterium]|nr:carbohydrate kinase [Gaiellaceae bacterium]
MIVIGGEALVDLVDDGGAPRQVAGGGPFNTAIAFGRLDVPVGFLGTISRDADGAMLACQLTDSGVDTSLVRWSDAPTPHAVVERLGDGRNEYTFHLGGTSFTDFPSQELPVLPEKAWAVHVGTLALAIDPPASAYEALVDRETGRRQIILDPNVRPAIFGDAGAYRRRFERLAQVADVVKLSDDDAAWIYPGLPVDEVLRLTLDFGPRVVAVTRGENGALAGSKDVFVDIPGIRVEIVDTVGAGDSFGAALVAALVDEDVFGPDATRDPDEGALTRAVSYAVAASAITCTRTGAVPPSRDEIEAQLRALATVRARADGAEPALPC